ncbi:MarR family transcriptional regulator [Rhodopseudomonas boonkerdii]|uniref:MarR family winged helix-turn-helix transcriptional regulator n=1 Tax=Rhodopseudomonas boonkerdii TaxID=475937 RepID=UPI001E4472DF|nr:MarR family transcriptional regulator [Rhodopseudomonas boonkerdii]UGV27576.1 MarR family transcriptional regulator [Rhodopseudomonas boonkerdii]
MPRSRAVPPASAVPRRSKSKLPVPPLTTSCDALLVDGSDHAFRQLVHTLLAFVARHDTVLEGHAAAVGLSAVEYTVLTSLNLLGAEGQVSVRELAAHLHLSGAFVTTVSNKLQEMGLLEKLTDPEDRRRLRLVVTEQGEALLARLAPIQRQVNDVQFDCLGAGDFARLLASVEKLVESSDKAIALQKYLQPRKS